MKSINEIRTNTYIKINESIEVLNNLNRIIYDGSDNAPKKIRDVLEDKGKISLSYLKNSLEYLEKILEEISKRNKYLEYMIDKKNECVNTLNTIIEMRNL
ncbi:hypothetical protein [Fluviispira vulneris]|uniref:hypothetical protein n=1 Tax=Fluviispira vulneris TaxID=2763012 RepID=UPI001648E3FA|nr:hypothetical protein [Fluviispira vulneris]